MKRILTVLLSLVMTVTYMPAASFAEPISDQKAANTEAVNGIAASSENDAAEKEEAASGNEAAASDAADSSGSEKAAFIREAEIDDVIIRVEADAGVFPEEAELIAEKDRVSRKAS